MSASPAGETSTAARGPVPVRRLPAPGQDTPPEPADRRLAVLLAAEKLFALKGYHGVSIRDIAADAGVPLALVGYYYGAKHQLYHAIFESWRPMIDARLNHLAAVRQDAQAPDRLQRILEAFVDPVLALQQHAEGRYYALMAARELAVPTAEADRAQREFFDPMAHAFIAALCELYPAATRGQVAWGYQFMLGALLHFLTDRRVERLSGHENRATDPAARGRLLAFMASGFRAVVSPVDAVAATAPAIVV